MAQISTIIGEHAACNDSITIPIMVENCNNVAAISLKLQFNNQLFNYVDYSNENLWLGDGLLMINANANYIYISWFAMSTINIGTDTLVSLSFAGNGVSMLEWDTITTGSCEYVDLSGAIIPSLFTSGSLSLNEEEAPELIAPANNASMVQSNCTFQWNQNACFNQMNFQLSDDAAFSNLIVDSILSVNELQITGLTMQSNYYWRVANIGTNTLWSDTFTLYTDLTTANELTQPAENIESIVFPNPFTAQAKVRIYSQHSELISMNVFNMLGSKVAIHKTEQTKAGWNNYSFGEDLKPGTYFILIEKGEGKESQHQSIIITKK